MTVTDDDVDIFLEHFGVKGMHWGVRKGRDTPADKQAKRESRAKKHDAEVAVLDSRINAVKNSKMYPGRKRAKLDKLEEKRRIEKDKADARRAGKLSKHEKHQLAGAAAVAALIAAYVTYDSIQSGNGQRIVNKGKAFVESRGKSKFTFKTKPVLADKNLTEDQIMSMVVPQVNPGYKSGKWGSKMNCRRATMTYEMRRRGYDVTATHTSNARGQNVIGLTNAIRPGSKTQRTGKPSLLTKYYKKDRGLLSDMATYHSGVGKNKVEPGKIFSELNKMPDGARGELGMVWNGGRGGHSMAWEKIKGKVVIFDTQTGKKYSDSLSFKDIQLSMDQAGFTRLDNLPMNSDYLMRWMKNA